MSRPSPLAGVLIVAVTGYRRLVSPLLGPRCRFSPTCSSYAVQALARHGAVKGGLLTVWRLLRCHPFHPGGHDPVPDRPLRLGRPEVGRHGRPRGHAVAHSTGAPW